LQAPSSAGAERCHNDDTLSSLGPGAATRCHRRGHRCRCRRSRRCRSRRGRRCRGHCGHRGCGRCDHCCRGRCGRRCRRCRGRWSLVMAVIRRSWPLVVSRGCRLLVVAVGHRMWPLAIGRCRPLSSVIVVTAIVALPVLSAAPSMAEDTASIGPAGGVRKAPHSQTRGMAYGGREGRGVSRWRAAKTSRGGLGECQRVALTATARWQRST
jgi:hypothetical protein